LRERIHRAAAGALPGPELLAEVVALDALLGERFARAALAAAGRRRARVEAIGLHGQTLAHLPRRRARAAREAGTLQIGSAALVAERTGIAVVSGLRARDMAAGGEGAPLVPILDHALYARRGVRRALVNLGGIANVTLLPGDGRVESVRAFDTGPANMLLDRAIQHATGGRTAYDRGGRAALSGRVSQRFLSHLLRHPFLALRPPKSADRADFEGVWWTDSTARARRLRLSLPDLLATLAAFTAESVAAPLRGAFGGRGPDEVLVSGGGARNRAILQELKRRLSGARVARLPGAGEEKEALLFAFLARQFLLGRAGNLPRVTGARAAVVLGHYTPAPPRRRRP
jgi:anhydro-N-acetylmuramic acid kinase